MTPRAFMVADASVVTANIVIGGDLRTREPLLALRQLDELVEYGVTHIIDVRDEWSDESFVREGSDIEYLHHGIDDAGQRVPACWFEEVASWARGALAGGGVILVHCHMGINRGPSLGFALLLDQGWDPVEALDAIRAARPIAHMAYVDDAVSWYHDRCGASLAKRGTDFRGMKAWRRENGLDVAEVIRGKRAAGY